jgi:Ca2+-binding RTX toxin-like protein
MATKKGTKQDNMLKGTSSNDMLLGRAGDDTLFGNGGNDRLDGGNGDDELLGGNGNDLLLPGQGGADAMDGGKGIDTVSYANFNTNLGVHVQLGEGSQVALDDALGDTFLNVERFIGTNASDAFYLLRPGAGPHYVFGGDGADVLRIEGGVARGGDGNDSLVGDLKRDWVDTFWFDRDGGTDNVGYFTDGQDRLRISGKEFGVGGLLNSNELFNRAADADPTGTKAQFIFRMDEDQLFFDPDGTGSEAATLLADFTDTSVISALGVDDFEIV